MDIENCEGYQRLLADVERNEKQEPGFHDYRGKLAWVVARAKQYAEATGLEASLILDTWEKGRNYWYMNYYQDANQPMLTGERVRVFETVEEAKKAMGKKEFRCPRCSGISTDPYECNSGIEIGKNKKCDWKSWGLFGDLGKGVFVFIKDQAIGQTIFMPVAWEERKDGTL